VLDAKEANIGFLKGKQIEQAKKLDSTVPSKSVKGGMCLHESTMVTNGKVMEIKNVKTGDKILSVYLRNNSVKFSKIEDVMKRNAEKAYKIITSCGKEIVTTPEHLFFKKDETIKETSAEDIKIGDTILAVNLDTQTINTTKIIDKKIVKPNGFFFDLFVPTTSNFIANGIVVHNSQGRYDRIREDALNEFFTKVADSANEIFLKEKDLKGIIIGGPGPTKETFFREKYLNYMLQKKVLGVKDIGYTGEEGLEELVQRSMDLLEQAAVTKERELTAKLFSELKTGGNVVYGLDEVRKAIEVGAVEQLLVSEEFNYMHVRLKCQNGHEDEKDLPRHLLSQQKCVECGQQMNVVSEQEIVDDLIEQAAKVGATVEYISINTPEGRQFREIGGIAAFLRYKLS